MEVKELKCQRCGSRFEKKVLDDREVIHRPHAAPVRCPECGSTMIETVRTLRHVSR